MSQNDLVLQMLKDHPEGITAMDALQPPDKGGAGCFRLAARIYELRDAGWPIMGYARKLPSGKTVTLYVLLQPAVQRSLWK